MKKSVVITIIGSQVVDDVPSEEVEITTVADLYDKNGVAYLRYQESELTGFAGCTTTLKIEGNNKVTMIRQGQENRTQMIIERGRRHQCSYFNGMGDMILGITGGEIQNTILQEDGELIFSYTLDMNSYVTSENRVHIHYHTFHC